MTCPRLTCIGVYLVGALDDSERIQMYDHMDRCPECRREFEDLAPVVEFLAAATPLSASQRKAGDRGGGHDVE